MEKSENGHTALVTRRRKGIAMRNLGQVFSLFISTLSGLLLWSNAIATPAHATPSNTALVDEAKAFIETLSTDAITVLEDQTLNDEAREKAFRSLLSKNFDLHYIARFTLGRNSRTASKRDVVAYHSLFDDYVIQAYATRLTAYAGEEIRVKGAKAAGTKDILVLTEIKSPSSGQTFVAEWRVRPRGPIFRVIDIKIEGISMVITQREEFSAIIKRKGMDGLIKTLEDRTGQKAEYDSLTSAQLQ